VLRILRTGLHVECPRQQAAKLGRHLSRARSLCDSDVDLVELAGLLADALCLGQGEDGDRRPAELGYVAELRESRDPVAPRRNLSSDAHRLTHLEAVLVGRALVERDLTGVDGRVARGISEWVE